MLAAINLRDDATLAWPAQPHDTLNKSALAISIGAEKHNRLAGIDFHRDIFDDPHGAVTCVNVLDRQTVTQDTPSRPQGYV